MAFCRDTWEDHVPWRENKHILLSLSTDSSGFAWGGVFHLPDGDLEVRDYWNSHETMLQISTKEMLEVLKVLQGSPITLRNCRVNVNVDSQILLDTWCRERSRSPQLTSATKEPFLFVSKNNLQLSLNKVPSEENRADQPSRRTSRSDTLFSPRCWQKVQEQFGGISGQ